MSERIVIAGAGPAGLVAALTLARAGRRVDLFERRATLGARFIGDLHGIENWSTGVDFLDELGEIGVSPTFECVPCRTVVLTDGTHVRTIEKTRPLFYRVVRGHMPGSLEHGLYEQAVAAGVRVRFDTPAPPGAASIVATGPDPRRRFCLETGIRFRTSAPDMAVALVNEHAAPGGYAYLLIGGGWGCLGVVMFARFDESRRCLDDSRRLLERAVPFDVRGAQPLGGFGSLMLPCRFGDGAALYAGEAAGLQDLVWGFGIRKAIQSGYLAAVSLLAAGDGKAALERRFNADMRVGLVNRYLWERSAARGMRLYTRLLMRSRGSVRALTSAHQERWIHRLLLPAARARLCRRLPSVIAG